MPSSSLIMMGSPGHRGSTRFHHPCFEGSASCRGVSLRGRGNGTAVVLGRKRGRGVTLVGDAVVYGFDGFRNWDSSIVAFMLMNSGCASILLNLTP